MGYPIYGPFQFQTRQYYDAEGVDTAKGSTLTFEDLDQSLLFLSSSIANVNPNIDTGSLLLTASANLNVITFTKGDGTTQFNITVDTGSGQAYTAGDGLNLVGNEFSSKVLTVNGQDPDGSGNITTALTAVETGTSSSLIESSSGTVTGSIINGTVWVISGDGDATKNGDTYIFKSGSVGQWYQISPLDEVAADARYVRLSSTSLQTITSSLLISGSTIFSGSIFWSGASDLGGGANNVLVLGTDGKIYKTGSYGTGGGGPGTPGGVNTTIQFNDGGTFSGSNNFTFNKTTNVVNLIGTGSITGSMIISRSVEGTPLSIIGTGSSPILNVIGSTGNLLQAYDITSGDIFTVGDYPSGLPILRVTSNRETFIGNSNAPGLYNSFVTSSVNAGNHVVYQVLTSSYNALWIDYSAYSGSNFRAGTFNTMWSGSTIQYIDLTGSNFGNTNNLTFSSSFSSSYLQVTASIVTTNGWFIKGIIRAI